MKKEDFERQTRVLLEEIRHEVKIIAEGHSSLSSRLDNIEAMLNNSEQESTTIKEILFDINGRLKDCENRIIKLENKV
ncbi:MAG: hypothetical protein PHP46_01285 [Candidatus Omnitrophica bacterium]|nr:hypothetical protein [Candidatus Omnitrophota bacterium]